MSNKINQNRPPPGFQEYASSMLSNIDFRTMPLPARGLLYQMRLECWVNHKLPVNQETLAKYLGITVKAMNHNQPLVMPFFANQGNVIICPELEDYREYLRARKEAQAAGGKKGAEVTNAKHKHTAAAPIAESAGYSTGKPRVTRESLGQLSSVQISQDQSSGSGNDLVEDFTHGYEKTEYAIASRGGG